MLGMASRMDTVVAAGLDAESICDTVVIKRQPFAATCT